MYITKDSGKRIEYKSGMVRDTTEDKIRFDLLIPNNCKHPMLIRWAEILTRGAVKYTPRNFEKAYTEEELDRAKQSLWRHFIQYVTEVDDGEDHAAALYFNIQVVELIKEKLKEDKCSK